MASKVVLVNGLPGSGKTTLATALAAQLGAQLLSKDAVKQALAASPDYPASCPSLGAIAMQRVWGLAAALPGTVVLDSWWFRPRDLRFAAAGLERIGTSEVIEIWCDLPPDLAKARYARRDRSAMFDDAWHLANVWDDWVTQAQPLALSAVLRVDTSSPVNYPELTATLIAQFAEGARLAAHRSSRIARS